MPNRILRTSALTSRKLGQVSPAAEALYYRLMLVVDDFGRYHGETEIIQSHCYPRGERQVAKPLTELVEAGAIHLYDINEDRYLAFDKWDQSSRAKESKFPAPDDGVRADATPLQTSARKRTQTQANAPLDVDVFGDGDGDVIELERGEKPPRKRNPLVDTLAEIESSDPTQLTRSHARSLGVAVAEIQRATPDVSPDEIRRRASVYRDIHPTWELTGPALAKHWAGCVGRPQKQPSVAAQRVAAEEAALKGAANG